MLSKLPALSVRTKKILLGVAVALGGIWFAAFIGYATDSAAFHIASFLTGCLSMMLGIGITLDGFATNPNQR